MPQPQVPGPGFVVPPPGVGVVPIGYPAGFVPQGVPQAPVIPDMERSPRRHSPVIPEPPGWDMPDPARYGGRMGPVRPAETPYEEYPPLGPVDEYDYHPEDEGPHVPSPPSDVTHLSREPLPVPGPGAFNIPQTPAEHDSRTSTPTQESYRPPRSPGALPVPVGAVGGAPGIFPIGPQGVIPPPGQLVQPQPIVVQTSPPGGIPVQLSPGLRPVGMPVPGMHVPGMPIPMGTPQRGVAVLPSEPGGPPIVINPPPVQVPYSRPVSRVSAREPIVVVQDSGGRPPVQLPATVVQIPTSTPTHDPIHTSPSIRAIPDPHITHEIPRSPSPRGRRPRRHRYPESRRGSWSYSPDDDYYGRYRYPDDRYRGRYYPPSDRGYDRGYRGYDYSPGRRHRPRSYDYEESPEGRSRRRRPRDRDGDRDERERDEGRSPEDHGRRPLERRPSHRSDYPEAEERDPGDRPRPPPSHREGDTAGHPPATPSHIPPPLSPAPPTIIRLGGGEPRGCGFLWFLHFF